MNTNSLIVGFVSGFICGFVMFLANKTKLVKKLLNGEKIRDMSYYGRKSRK